MVSRLRHISEYCERSLYASQLERLQFLSTFAFPLSFFPETRSTLISRLPLYLQSLRMPRKWPIRFVLSSPQCFCSLHLQCRPKRPHICLYFFSFVRSGSSQALVPLCTHSRESLAIWRFPLREKLYATSQKLFQFLTLANPQFREI